MINPALAAKDPRAASYDDLVDDFWLHLTGHFDHLSHIHVWRGGICLRCGAEDEQFEDRDD